MRKEHGIRKEHDTPYLLLPYVVGRLAHVIEPHAPQREVDVSV